MSSLILERVHNRHPFIHTGLNAGHPLAPYCAELSLATTSGLRSLHSYGTDLGSSATERVWSKSGPALRTAAVTSSQYMTAPMTLKKWSTNWTLYGRVRVTALAGDSGTSPTTARYIYSIWPTSSTCIGFTRPTGITPAIGAFVNLGANRAVTPVNVTADVEYDCFVSKPEGSAIITLEVYRVGTGTSSATTGAVTPADPVVRLGYAGSTSAPGDKTFIVGAFFHKELTASERALIAANPWALFKPRQIIVPYAAAVGAPTITALSAIGITATSAQPRISYS